MLLIFLNMNIGYNVLITSLRTLNYIIFKDIDILNINYHKGSYINFYSVYPR